MKRIRDKDWTGDGKSIWKTLGASNHTSNERQGDDYYATDPVAIDRLLSVESPNKYIWECACGGGHLSDKLIQKGYVVWSSDIVNRGYQNLSSISNFLTAEEMPFYYRADILTNPPYKYAKEFVLKALELLSVGCKCYMFLKLQFLEGVARYNEIFQTHPLNRCTYLKNVYYALKTANLSV